MSLRVLHLSNFSAGRCGIKNFGCQLSTALRRAGCDLQEWDIEYSHIYELIQRGEPAYLPADVSQFDVLQYNWHPITTNTYGPGHFDWPRGSKPLVSVYLHDIPPWSGCPFHDRADLLIASEPSPQCLELPYPLCDWIEDLPEPSQEFSVGWSGVRGDGAFQVKAACEAAGYRANPPGKNWISYEDEIRRLAKSSVNVAWYHEGRGLSGGASQLASARRPLILNGSPMFAHLLPYQEEIYFAPSWMTLPDMLSRVYEEWTFGRVRKPSRILRELSWSRSAAKLLAVWKEKLSATT